MASDAEHGDHKDPTLVATALPIWLAAIPVVWIFVAHFGYLTDSLIAFAVWGIVCFWLCSTFDCRNATRMSGLDGAKGLALIVLPWGALLWYAVNADTLTRSLGDVSGALAA
ncbi:hypothetical protein ACVXZ4_04165 [Lacisediminihabitans sp. FW035]